MLSSQVVLLILAIGLLYPLRAGDYDLSVASTLNLSTVVVAILNVQHGWNIWPRSSSRSSPACWSGG